MEHIGADCGVCKSAVCAAIHRVEDTLVKDGTIRLSGKKALHHKVRGAGLSEKAKRRSGVSGWYFMKSARHSANGKPNAALICRHFGTRQSQFYRRQARYGKTRLALPGTGSTAPKRKREPGYSRAPVAQAQTRGSRYSYII